VTVLTDRLGSPNTRKVALLEMTAGQRMVFWTASGSNSYYASTDYRVVGMRENGSVLYERASAASVDSTAGTWYWDQAAGRVYVHPTGSVNANTKIYQAIVWFGFGTAGRIANGRYYEGRIKSLPSLSMRIEPTFGDPGQIGSGSVSLVNSDGGLDDLSSLQWDAGESVLKLGIDEISRSVAPGQGVGGVEASEVGGFVGSDEGGCISLAITPITTRLARGA
jgi:hypothetical protein